MSDIIPERELIERWLAQFAIGTSRCYTLDFHNFRTFIGEKSVEDVQRSDIEAFMQSSVELSIGIQERRLSCLRSFFRFCCDNHFLTSDPTSGVRHQHKYSETEEITVISEPEVQRIIALALNPRDRIIVFFLYYCAMTADEISKLRWKDILIKSGTSIVRIVSGRKRDIPLPNFIVSELRKMHADYALDDPVIITRSGGEIDSHRIQKIVKEIGVFAGLPELSPRWLRTSHAIHAYERGAKLNSIQDALGLSSMRAVLRYIKTSPKAQATIFFLPPPKRSKG